MEGSRAANAWGVAAFGWALLFALQSWYGAAGGRVGIETFGPAVTDQVVAGDRAFIAALWVIGAAKLGAGLLALSLVRPWGRRLPRRWVRLVVLVAGLAFLAYGLANLLQHALMAAGVLDVPAGLGRTAMWWHLGLWDPWWLVGGALFVLTARRSRPADVPAGPRPGA